MADSPLTLEKIHYLKELIKEDKDKAKNYIITFKDIDQLALTDIYDEEVQEDK